MAGSEGPAHAFLASHAETRFRLTFTIAGEVAAGYGTSARPRWESFLAPFDLLPATPEVCWRYGQLFRYLNANGLLIGGNDLWIAATAVAFASPLVTRNTKHFNRVPGLEVVTF
jgi:predicted nucleic acid-binding protein